MKEYKMARSKANLTYISAPLLIVLFISLLVAPFLPGTHIDLKALWIFAPISMGMIALCIVSLLQAKNEKFVIGENEVWHSGAFFKSALYFNEIKGYREVNNQLLIEPVDKKQKKIKLGAHFERRGDILHWLAGNYPNLDILEANAEREKILQDQRIGANVEQREEKILQAFRHSNGLTWASGIISVWTIFLAMPYELCVAAVAIFPLLCLALLKYYDGLIRIDAHDNSLSPSIFPALFFPVMALFLRALMDFNILDHTKLLAPTCFAFLLLLLLTIIGKRTYRRSSSYPKPGYIFLLCCMGLAYCFGTVITVNCLLDQSKPERFQRSVIEKNSGLGILTTYYIKLGPWAYQEDSEQIQVSKELFDAVELKDSVSLYCMSGRLGIPWFVVQQ